MAQLNTVQAGSTMLGFSVASWLIIPRVCIIMLRPNRFIKYIKPISNMIASFSLIFVKIIIERLKSFPPTSGQIPPTSSYFHWLNWEPHMTSYVILNWVFEIINPMISLISTLT